MVANVWVVFPDRQTKDGIGYTPNIEGGIGPVDVLTPNGVEAEDGRVACHHSWSEVTQDWFEAQGCIVVETLPPDFVIKQEILS